MENHPIWGAAIDSDMDMSGLVEAAKADFHKEKKRTLITEIILYIKPEGRTAYYAINGTYNGQVSF